MAALSSRTLPTTTAARFTRFRGEASITNSSFVRNRGPVGGAIYAINRKVGVANSTFSENQSGAGGGALDLVAGEFTLTHLTFVGNKSDTGAGNAINRISGSVYLRNSILGDGDYGDECEGGLAAECRKSEPRRKLQAGDFRRCLAGRVDRFTGLLPAAGF